jgi:cell division septal protein FtsQ
VGSIKGVDMQALSLLPKALFFALILLFQQGGSPTIPGTFPPPQPARPSLPDVNGPPTVVRKEPQPKLNPAKAKEQASQLAKLAESIPPDVEKATHGQLPQDLASRLKQIEKLAKELRHEIAP